MSIKGQQKAAQAWCKRPEPEQTGIQRNRGVHILLAICCEWQYDTDLKHNNLCLIIDQNTIKFHWSYKVSHSLHPCVKNTQVLLAAWGFCMTSTTTSKSPNLELWGFHVAAVTSPPSPHPPTAVLQWMNNKALWENFLIRAWSRVLTVFGMFSLSQCSRYLARPPSPSPSASLSLSISLPISLSRSLPVCLSLSLSVCLTVRQRWVQTIFSH